MKFNALMLAGAMLAASFTAVGANAAIVVNGDFETGDFTGWTPDAVSFPIYIVTAPVAGGNYAAQIAGFSFGPDTLSQTVATTAGHGYTLSFDYWQDGGTPNGFDVSWNGVSVFSQTDTDTGVAYQHVTANVVGSGSDTLVFTAYNDPAFSYVDNVALGTVPEPATWALMLFGFGGLGTAMRARRRTASLIA